MGSPIVYIKNERYFLYDDGKFKPTKPNASKKYFTASTITSSYLFFYSNKVMSGISDEQLSVQMDINMHDEGGANPEEEYESGYLRYTLTNEGNDLIDLYALSKMQSDAYFANIIKNCPCIDLVVPSFMVYESMYQEEQKSVDLILHIGKHESFGALYQNGKYIAHRGVDSLFSFAKKTDTSLDVIYEALKTKGIVEENYEAGNLLLSNLQDYFSKSIERIAHAINHKRGLFGFDKIDRIIIDFNSHELAGINSVFEAFAMSDIPTLSLTHQSSQDGFDVYDFITADYMQGVLKKKYKTINLTHYKRKPAFYRQPAGILLLVAFFSLVIVSLYIFVLNQEASMEQESSNLLQKQLELSKKSNKEHNATLSKFEQENQLLSTKQERLTKEINLWNEEKENISNLKKSSQKRQEMVDFALKNLAKYNLKLSELEHNTTKRLILHIITNKNSEKNIASFMKDMSKSYENVMTDKIYLDKNKYKSIVEIKQ